MINLKTILNEVYNLHKMEFLLVSDINMNKSEIINRIRAVPYVVIVRVIEDPRLTQRNNDKYEYTLLSIKFIDVFGRPSKTALQIRNITRAGDNHMNKIKGVYKFKPLFSSVKRLK